MVLDNEWLFILPRKPSSARAPVTALKVPLGPECGAANNERNSQWVVYVREVACVVSPNDPELALHVLWGNSYVSAGRGAENQYTPQW